jgi:cysteinyl-tRNA synthetase
MNPQPFSLFDSYQKKIINIDPALTIVPGYLTFYSCGPTVYNYMHIGNLRATWLADTINLVARIAGYDTRWIMNITDVGHMVNDGDDGKNVTNQEDKIELAARQSGESVNEIVSHYSLDFFNQAKSLNLNIPKADNLPYASKFIEEQMQLVLQLVSLEKAYILEDGIYFDSQSVSSGDNKFTGRDIKNTTKNPADFALWKFVTEQALQKWKFNQFDSTAHYILDIQKNSPTEFNLELPNMYGTPGWHTECVAMICKLVSGTIPPQIKSGKTIIDLHLGGEDHIDIHHKNEILQSEAAGFELSQHWVHNKFVLVDSAKMSKSKGNIYRLTGDDENTLISRGYDPLSYRLMLIEHHYTEQLNFTFKKLDQSQSRLYNLRKDFAQITSYISNQKTTIPKFEITENNLLLQPLLQNLDTPSFIEKFQKLVGEVLRDVVSKSQIDSTKLSEMIYWEKEFLKLDLYFEIPENIYKLASERLEVKALRNYEISDKLRQDILNLGYQIDDYPWGFGIWKKQISKIKPT